jgi:hypothetical protein
MASARRRQNSTSAFATCSSDRTMMFVEALGLPPRDHEIGRACTTMFVIRGRQCPGKSTDDSRVGSSEP